MSFPSYPVEAVSEKETKFISQACHKSLGLRADDIQFVGANEMDVLIEVCRDSFLRIPRTIDPQPISEIDTRVVIITTALEASDRYNVHSRCFAPRYGVIEDPVTGSAHCAIGPYWINKLGLPVDHWLYAQQGGTRQGSLAVRLEGERVLLRGKVIPTIIGRLSNEITRDIQAKLDFNRGG